MRTIPRRLLRDSIAVEAYSGTGAYGPVYAAAVTVRGRVSMTRQLVRNSNGVEVVSEMTLHLHRRRRAIRARLAGHHRRPRKHRAERQSALAARRDGAGRGDLHVSLMRWHGEKAKAAAAKGAARGLKQWADDVLEASRKEVPVAPVGGGMLRDSGKAEVDKGALRAFVSYTGPEPKSGGRRTPNVNVAILMHEAMRFHHTTGRSKYLEGPLNASKKSGRETVAAEIKKALG